MHSFLNMDQSILNALYHQLNYVYVVRLHYGTISDQSLSRKELIEEKRIIKKNIPILTWEQVADFIDPSKSNAEIKEYISHFFIDQPRWYALRIKNDAMTVPMGNHISFKERDIIIVDPDKAVEHNNFIIALLPRSKEVTFKQYVIDGGGQLFKTIKSTVSVNVD